MKYQIASLLILYGMGGYTASFVITSLKAKQAKRQNLTRSVCWNCNHKLNFIDLLPVFGFLIRKGKCAYCKTSIDKKYFLYELLIANTFLTFMINIKLGILVNLIALSSIIIKELKLKECIK